MMKRIEEMELNLNDVIAEAKEMFPNSDTWAQDYLDEMRTRWTMPNGQKMSVMLRYSLISLLACFYKN
jgi:ribonucleotide reductase alpha subunit